MAHKDVDAQWTSKNKTSYYGCKNHVKTDSKSKIVTKYIVTDASVHDSQSLGLLLDAKHAKEPFHADNTYIAENQDFAIRIKR